ncbi:hypothetical protein [Nocardia inohanensis]|uniref:hypothetical protein n=1 Tax=Nocardia inohanensis TaxID=209246 RepID=UPI0012FBE713|nr:hypothetical protein [Nocardia inohanensis]
MSETRTYALHGVATWDALDTAWNSWGRKDRRVIAQQNSPAFIDGPEWPALRQAHLIVRRDDALMVASSGLSDPAEWDNSPNTNGFELEVYAISPDVPVDSGTVEVAASWLGQTVMTVSNLVARYGFQVIRMLEHYGLITIPIDNAVLPPEAVGTYLDAGGQMVVMLGLTDREVPGFVDGPLSRIRLVNIKILTAAEGQFCVDSPLGEIEAQHELARRFAAQGDMLWSSLRRPSVV